MLLLDSMNRGPCKHITEKEYIRIRLGLKNSLNTYFREKKLRENFSIKFKMSIKINL